jgi:DNA-binding GntR family transcriptional regulator
MAAATITKAEVARLREINQEIEANIESNEAIGLANHRFHSAIAAACGNLVVRTFTETLLTVSEGGSNDLNHSPAFRRSVVADHYEIIDALDAKDPDRAEEAMRKHVSMGKGRRAKENRDLMSRPLRWVQ